MIKQYQNNGNKVSIMIVYPNKCKPTKCQQECKKKCPVNMQNKKCIEIEEIAKISNELCISCGICKKTCPFNAITHVNIPSIMMNLISHSYGENAFRLHRLPIPKIGNTIGLIGNNGIGKSTTINILSGKIIPNLGKKEGDYMKYVMGTELQQYFELLTTNKLKISCKIQNIDSIVRSNIYHNKKVKDIIPEIKGEDYLNINRLMDKYINNLSGGELQRFVIYTTSNETSDVYIFDEPSCYLDIKQRINMIKLISSIDNQSTYKICIDHDLSVLDYLCNYIHCLYGQSGCYGIVTTRFNNFDGINCYLNGYIPNENMRFRDNSLHFKFSDDEQNEKNEIEIKQYNYKKIIKKYDGFELVIENGSFSDSEIIVLIGENGIGKTTFLKILAGIEKADDKYTFPEFYISYKPQIIKPTQNKTVKQLLDDKIGNVQYDELFKIDILKPLNIYDIMELNIINLSGGELQKVAIVLALGKPASIYLIDEPSAHLDCEQRIIVSKCIKKFIRNTKKIAIIVEHDFMMTSYLADKIILFDGVAGVKGTAKSPTNVNDGINQLLENLDITCRRDHVTYRPRINKINSQKDIAQKKNKNYLENLL
jgi:ATP-binding cassette subfamily E protein 1